MQPNRFTVYIVEDDPSVRDALGLLLGLQGYSVSMFADAESFQSAYKSDWSGCTLVDIRMPGMDGLALQQWLVDQGCKMPAIIMTGHGDVGSARQAFRAQAVDFLEKPIDQAKLIEAITDAYARYSSVTEQSASSNELANLLATLTPREREVMELVVAGRHNRDIADMLGISVRTVEVHKTRMMLKLKADGVADLVRISLGINST
ncbi:MAG: sigma-70 family RNA polymerase sigma factor [Sulfuritalea sp.]|nr:sigma-70 family RNA polymerase sigma factor [Sulfuritalea sp.]